MLQREERAFVASVVFKPTKNPHLIGRFRKLHRPYDIG